VLELEKILLFVTIVAYLTAAALLTVGIAYRKKQAERGGVLVLGGGFLVHTVAIGVRWVAAGRPPFADLIEALVFLAWCTALAFLIVNRRNKLVAPGLILVPVAFFTMAVAGALYTPPQPLPEELRSYWLAIHVGVSLIGYSAFALAFATGFFYVVQEDLIKKRYPQVRRLILGLVVALGTGTGLYVGYLIADPTLFEDAEGARVYAYSTADITLIALGTVIGLAASITLGWIAARGASRPSFANRLPALDVLDRLSHRSVMVGFGFLALGIVSGALWAQEAWGGWWRWDPKETWAFMAWLFYGGYLGLRTFADWRGRHAAVLAITGLFLILFTFLGVNLLVPGKHDFN
jgi:cytochrome c-type biogenesis protein CcsB